MTTGTFYHLEGEPCPSCGEEVLMYGNPGDGTYVECDPGVGGCGERWGPIEESDWGYIPEEMEEIARGYIEILNTHVECSYCEWEGTIYETDPLGKMTEETYEETIGTPWELSVRSMNECPECGDPTPTRA